MVIPRVLVRLSSLAPRGPLSSQAMLRRVFVCMRCVFGPDSIAAVIRDFWPVDQHHLHINVKEALALANALDAFSSSFCDSWVDVYTDSQVLIGSWRYQGSKIARSC